MEIGSIEQNDNICFIRRIQMKNITATTSIPNIAECKRGFEQYADKIDKVNLMLDRVNVDLTALEHNVAKAEEELGYNSTGIKGFFKPFIEKVVKNDRIRTENSEDQQPVYQSIAVFKTSDYFDTNCDRSNDTDQITNE